MDSAWKDILLLVTGGLLGVPASMAASLLLGPAMTIMCGFGIVKWLSKLRQSIRPDKVFDGPWTETWRVRSDHYPPENPSDVRIYRFLHLFAAETTHTTSTGTTSEFRVLGVIDGDRYITGKWMDPLKGGYYGAFQLKMLETHEGANGRWIGFSSTGIVKTGEWTWNIRK